MKQSSALRVGIYDQIVSGGGVRFFTTKLLAEFSRLAGSRWNFHLMWPLFDSSNRFLPRPRLPNVTFERVPFDGALSWEDRAALGLARISGRDGLLGNRDSLGRVEERIARIREREQKEFRSGSGHGLRWLDQRMANFDLVFVPYPYLTLPTTGGWSPTKPLVITLHDLAHEFTDTWGEATMRLRREVRLWTQLADLIVFSSDWVRDAARELYQFPPARARTIFLSPTSRPPPRNNRRQRGPHRGGLPRNYVFTLGWAAKHKRVGTIIKGFALFKKETQSDHTLVIAGPGTGALSHGDLLGLEVGKDIFLLDYISEKDIPFLYDNAAAVVTASTSEAGLNGMIFDAMTSERAIICSNIPQFIERLGTDNKLALLFDPDSPSMLARALSEHFTNPSKSQARIQEAKKFAATRTLTTVAREYLTAFESVL